MATTAMRIEQARDLQKKIVEQLIEILLQRGDLKRIPELQNVLKSLETIRNIN